MKKKLKKALVIVMALVMCINTMGINAIATEVSEAELVEQEMPNTEESVEEVSAEEVKSGCWDGVTKENSFEGVGFQVTFSLVEYWDTGFNATIKIQNTGENVIENWCVGYEFGNVISNIWNAEIFEQKENIYTIKNVGWNQDIAVGESVEFGISSNEGFQGFPKDYNLLGGNKQTNKEEYSVEYNWDSDWQTGFQGTVSITNNTENIIEDWTIEFDFENEITDIWDAKIISYQDNHYVIHNAGYNKDINANETVTFGIVVNEGDSTKELSNISVKKYVTKEKSETERELEPLKDFGKAYFKEATEDDVVMDKEAGVKYIRNQVLVSALPGAPKEAFEEIAEYIGAEIVGYIELTNDYQFEFKEDKTVEELDNMIAYLNSFSFVSYASLNLYEGSDLEMVATNDKAYNDGKTYNQNTLPDDWNEIVPQGDNWGLEALRVPSAWELVKKSSTVKVGVIDSEFSKHDDLVYDAIVNQGINNEKEHATHVAGILAAEHNNGIGISGVATNTRLYAHSSSGVGTSMKSKNTYMRLISNGVKVINVSKGENPVIQFAASHQNKDAQNYIESSAEIMGEFLNKLILQGYDFLIVTSAGNVEDDQYVEDESADYGYRKYSLSDDKKDIVQGKVYAYYNCSLAAIRIPNVKDRILVVGAVNHVVENGKTKYDYADFSNVGKRVDVCAPGQSILSTTPQTSINKVGLKLKDGTSMASPYIAGIAALMYQANSKISATNVKKIIVENRYNYVQDAHGNQYGIPDAYVCVQKAKDNVETDVQENILPSGLLIGTLVDEEKTHIKGAKITACRTSVDEANVDAYYKIESTNENGTFEIVLQNGIYDLNVYAEGYLPFTIKDVKVNSNNAIN